MNNFLLLILVLLIILYFINRTNKNNLSKFGDSTQQYRLNVNVVGNDYGSVISSPEGINTRQRYGRDKAFDIGTVVTLTADPYGQNNFAGWSGDASGNNSSTTITMNSHKDVTATFTPASYYILTTGTGGTGTGTVEVYTTEDSLLTKGVGGYGPFYSGTMLTITAIPTPPPSWRWWVPTDIFASWSGDVSGTSNSIVITMDNNKSVTAIFNKIQYRLNINKRTGGTGTGTLEVKKGNNILTGISGDYGLIDIDTVVTLTATSDGGSVFKGWYDSTDYNFSLQSSVNIIMDNNKSITARFEKQLQLYRLNGYTNGTGSGVVMAKNGNRNSILVPHNYYPYKDYDIGTVVTLTANPGSLSTFAGWSGSITSTSNPIDITMDDNKSIIATFNLIPFRMLVVKYGLGSGTVTSSPIGSDASTSSGNYGTFDPGTVVTITATPNGGSDFAGWELNNSDVILSTDNTYTITMDTPKTLVARFNKIQYTLTTGTDGTGSGTVKVQRVTALGTDIQPRNSNNYGPFESGTQLVLFSNPNPSSIFASWSGDVLGTTTYPLTYPLTYITMDNNKSVTATFNKIQYALTINTNGGIGGGSVTTNLSSANNLFDIGTVVTLTAIPNLQSIFASWSSNVTSTGKLTGTITIDSAKTVTAAFNIKQYRLNLNNRTGGTGTGTVEVRQGGSVLTGNSGYYGPFNSGTKITLRATASEGNVFAGWSPSVTSTGQLTGTITMDDNKSVTATFNIKQYRLNLNNRTGGTVEVRQGGSVLTGNSDYYGPFKSSTIITLTATPSGGNVFAGWSGDASGTTNPISVTMTKDKTVALKFDKQYKLNLKNYTGGTVEVKLDKEIVF